MRRSSLATMGSPAHKDFDNAILLADIISSSVRKLAQQSSRSALGVSEIDTSNNFSEALSTIVAATSQLSSLIRSTEEVIVDYATAVSDVISQLCYKLEHQPVSCFSCSSPRNGSQCSGSCNEAHSPADPCSSCL